MSPPRGPPPRGPPPRERERGYSPEPRDRERVSDRGADRVSGNGGGGYARVSDRRSRSPIDSRAAPRRDNGGGGGGGGERYAASDRYGASDSSRDVPYGPPGGDDRDAHLYKDRGGGGGGGYDRAPVGGNTYDDRGGRDGERGAANYSRDRGGGGGGGYDDRRR